jgi:hypothetical protein
MHRIDHHHPHGHHRHESHDRGGFGRRGPRSSDLGRTVFALMGAARAAAHAEPDQQDRIRAILDGARRAVYSVLAEAGTPPAGDPLDTAGAAAEQPGAASTTAE